MRGVIYLWIFSKNVNRWTNYFCQLLTVQEACGVWQTEIQTAEPLVPETSIYEVEVAIAKLKRYKSRVRRIRFQQNSFKWGAGYIRLLS
jgi:hypothetical protein